MKPTGLFCPSGRLGIHPLTSATTRSEALPLPPVTDFIRWDPSTAKSARFVLNHAGLTFSRPLTLALNLMFTRSQLAGPVRKAEAPSHR